MKLSIGYLCPFPLPIEILKELEGEYFIDDTELLVAGIEMLEDPGYIVGGLSWRSKEVDTFLRRLDKEQRFHLGRAFMMTAGDRMLSVEEIPSIRPDVVNFHILQRELAEPIDESRPPDLAALPE